MKCDKYMGMDVHPAMTVQDHDYLRYFPRSAYFAYADRQRAARRPLAFVHFVHREKARNAF